MECYCVVVLYCDVLYISGIYISYVVYIITNPITKHITNTKMSFHVIKLSLIQRMSIITIITL